MNTDDEIDAAASRAVAKMRDERDAALLKLDAVTSTAVQYEQENERLERRLSSGLELAKALHASTGFERMGELVGILAGWACEICKKPVSEGPRPGTDGVICCHCALGPERREDTFTVSKRVVETPAPNWKDAMREDYRAKFEAMSPDEKKRFLEGNWPAFE